MQYLVAAQTGESVKVDAENWMGAMSKAMAFFDVRPESMAQWTIQPLEEGAVAIEDRILGHRWRVEPVRSQLRVVVGPSSPVIVDEPELPVAREPTDEFDASSPPPALQMPVSSTLQPQERVAEPVHASAEAEIEAALQEALDEVRAEAAAAESPSLFDESSLAERLFDLTMDMASATQDEACRMALDIILEILPCEAASVVRAGRYDVDLCFAAASGPVGDRLVGRRLPFGKGLVGLSHDIGMTIIVNDVRGDGRHYTRVDAETGFVTRATLTVPVMDKAGTYGAIQLLNPDRPFGSLDVEVVETVARTLAGVLALGE